MQENHNDSKKQIPILLLEILKTYSDENKPLTQKEISLLLKKNYGISADRKTVKSNIMTLIECGNLCGYSIKYTTKRRIVNNEETEIYTNIYFEHNITAGELRFVTDNISSFHSISSKQRKNLIDNINDSEGGRHKIKNICELYQNWPSNSGLFFNLEQLDIAIEKHYIVKFIYNEYGIDGKLYPKRKHRYAVSPYKLAVAGGRYYLICKAIGMECISNYRVDKITDIEITKRKFINVDQINFPKHMAEHIYMFAGESERVTFQVNKDKVSDVIDWFGNEVTFVEQRNDYIIASVVVNHQAMKYWAMQYADYVQIISPAQLVNDVIQSLSQAVQKYTKNMLKYPGKM